NGLAGACVTPGDRVAVMMDSGPELLITYFGLLAAGAAPVPLNANQRGPALRHMLADCGAAVAVGDNACRRALAEHAPTTTRTLGCDELSRSGSDPLELPEDTRSGLGIMYTSGTTGPPKGIAVEGYEFSHVYELLAALEIAAGEVVYTALPLYHGNALIL